MDIAVPILYHGTVVAYVSFGQIKKDPDFASVADYLSAFPLDLDQELSIPLITQSTNVSKSTLYRNFHAHFGCTINEYITKRRLEYALSLLGSTKMSIEEIARAAGFSGATQFGKLFKKEYGVTPLKHRKQLPFA